jgi:hypothetical protein
MQFDHENDVQKLLEKQDETLRLLAKLRYKIQPTIDNVVQAPNQRRQYRRWAAPDSISLSVHNDDWFSLTVLDVGIGGVKVVRDSNVPTNGPFICKLGVGDLKNVLVLSDIMWMSETAVGIRFEFDHQDEHDLWAENLVDSLLSKLSI